MRWRAPPNWRPPRGRARCAGSARCGGPRPRWCWSPAWRWGRRASPCWRRLRWPEGTATGENPGETALEEEGFEDLSAEALTDGWARHLMANLDEWEARGHRRVTDRFLARLEDGAGAKRGIEPHTGALVIEQSGARQVRPL